MDGGREEEGEGEGENGRRSHVQLYIGTSFLRHIRAHHSWVLSRSSREYRSSVLTPVPPNTHHTSTILRLHPASYILHPNPYTLHLHPRSYTHIHTPAPCTLDPYTLHPSPCILLAQHFVQTRTHPPTHSGTHARTHSNSSNSPRGSWSPGSACCLPASCLLPLRDAAFAAPLLGRVTSSSSTTLLNQARVSR